MTNEGKQNPDYVGPDHQLPAHTEPAPHSTAKRIWVWILVLAAFALVLFLVIRHQDEVKAPTGRRAGFGPVSVTPTTARTGDIGVYLKGLGTVTPVYTASIVSQVTGQVIAVHYREGQLVRKGDPLVDIDPRPFEAQLLQAQGTLQHDTNVLAQAKMDLDRYRSAWAMNAIPKQTLDDQEKLVLQDEGTVKTDEGVVQFDEVQVGFCHITSPIAGRVGLRLVDPGNVVQTAGSTALAVVTQVQPITVIFTIPEDSLAQVQEQVRKGARLQVDAYDRTEDTKLATGTLLTIDNQIDTTTGSVKLRAQFDNKAQELFPNEFVNARLLVTTLHGVTLIPTSAIQHNGDAAFVYVLKNNHAKLQPVKPGTTDSTTTEVQGINSGDVLANSSFDKLQDGSQVKLSKMQLPGDSVETSAP
ncbi:efflux RND transporter periplasmic adaptor subunit [Acidicapsa ligni]|uniref:efflux RND transporter periplasmic adaptor subunit n=1 Tax=Acidicapsa ligni TaxID=542300 RepID=UPI0021E0BFD7|nr:efflux RND transporter periplasmic adaptor subunit [Acidicapsa ligni]